jgi:hypothetical protein
VATIPTLISKTIIRTKITMAAIGTEHDEIDNAPTFIV